MEFSRSQNGPTVLSACSTFGKIRTILFCVVGEDRCSWTDKGRQIEQNRVRECVSVCVCEREREREGEGEREGGGGGVCAKGGGGLKDGIKK